MTDKEERERMMLDISERLSDLLSAIVTAHDAGLRFRNIVIGRDNDIFPERLTVDIELREFSRSAGAGNMAITTNMSIVDVVELGYD